MRFTFSSKFRQSHYQVFLHELGNLTEIYRLVSGCSVKKMMADIHISHLVLKKY